METAPYFTSDGITIFNAETLATLNRMASSGECFDLIVADPPYGETSLQWDRWQPEFPAAARRVLAPGGSMWCFGSLRMFMEHAADFAQWRIAQDVVWQKHNGSNFHNDRFRRIHENVIQFYPCDEPWSRVFKAPQFTMDATARTLRRKGRPPHMGEIGDGEYESHDGGPRLQRSILEFRSCHGYAVHPTQKPDGLIRTLMRYSLKPGGRVLDPYMGSGPTLSIAREMGCEIVAIEGDQRHCDSAIARVAQTTFSLIA